VTVVYEDGKPVAVDTIVISTQHDDAVTHEKIERAMIENVIKQVIPAELLSADTKYFINPTGRFVVGGPAGDSGLTGRKIIVDTYGGYAPHGGGAFSGKDPTRWDRSAAYAARHAAKNVVAAGLARQCEIALAYAIGVAKPVSFQVNTRAPAFCPTRKLPSWWKRYSTCGPTPSSSAWTCAVHLPPDRRLRPLRPHGYRPALGAPGSGGRPESRRGHLNARQSFDFSVIRNKASAHISRGLQGVDKVDTLPSKAS
jgi:hypothetical protein